MTTLSLTRRKRWHTKGLPYRLPVGVLHEEGRDNRDNTHNDVDMSGLTTVKHALESLKEEVNAKISKAGWENRPHGATLLHEGEAYLCSLKAYYDSFCSQQGRELLGNVADCFERILAETGKLTDKVQRAGERILEIENAHKLMIKDLKQDFATKLSSCKATVQQASTYTTQLQRTADIATREINQQTTTVFSLKKIISEHELNRDQAAQRLSDGHSTLRCVYAKVQRLQEENELLRKIARHNTCLLDEIDELKRAHETLKGENTRVEMLLTDCENKMLVEKTEWKQRMVNGNRSHNIIEAELATLRLEHADATSKLAEMGSEIAYLRENYTPRPKGFRNPGQSTRDFTQNLQDKTVKLENVLEHTAKKLTSAEAFATFLAEEDRAAVPECFPHHSKNLPGKGGFKWIPVHLRHFGSLRHRSLTTLDVQHTMKELELWAGPFKLEDPNVEPQDLLWSWISAKHQPSEHHETIYNILEAAKRSKNPILIAYDEWFNGEISWASIKELERVETALVEDIEKAAAGKKELQKKRFIEVIAQFFGKSKTEGEYFQLRCALQRDIDASGGRKKKVSSNPVYWQALFSPTAPNASSDFLTSLRAQHFQNIHDLTADVEHLLHSSSIASHDVLYTSTLLLTSIILSVEPLTPSSLAASISQALSESGESIFPLQPLVARLRKGLNLKRLSKKQDLKRPLKSLMTDAITRANAELQKELKSREAED